MSIRIIKFCLTTAGLASLIMCITQEVDGVGRFAMIMFGIVTIYAGLLIKNK